MVKLFRYVVIPTYEKTTDFRDEDLNPSAKWYIHYTPIKTSNP